MPAQQTQNFVLMEHMLEEIQTIIANFMIVLKLSNAMQEIYVILASAINF